MRKYWNFVDSFAKLRKATINFFMSVRPSACPSGRNSSANTGRIFVKFDICFFFENLLTLTRMTGTLHENLCKIIIIPRWNFLTIRTISYKNYRENQKRRLIFNTLLFFPKSCRLSDSVEKYGTAGQTTDGNTIERMGFAYWVLGICYTSCSST